MNFFKLLFSVQDVCILFSAILILIMLINTFMFQAGLMGYMIKKFKSLWFVSALYLALCIALQVWLVVYFPL
jgi:transmembrane protein 138